MIILFDIDGVLIEHLAYKAGVQATTAYFAKRLGLEVAPPSRADIDVFESQSVTIEWDECGIIAALLVLERLRTDAASPQRRSAPVDLPADFWAALERLAPEHASTIGPLDYGGIARRVGAAARASGELPARAALSLLSSDLQAQNLPVATGQALLEGLLGTIYDIDRSPGMQVFQNYVLGDKDYARYYGLAPHVTGEALLEQLDRPLLAPELRDEVLARRAAGDVHPVIYTARPSLAPREAGAFVRGYTPESEIASRQVGLEAVPVMGYGKVDWVARRMGRTGSSIVKPSPVHAMACIAAAVTGQEVEAIEAAVAVEQGQPLRPPLAGCRGQAVHVFEDSASSLRAVKQAVELLNRHGLELALTCHGIAPQGSPKQATLSEVADRVHAELNRGLREVLGPAG